MPLDRYKDSGLLFNQNFLEPTSTPGLTGYRGELVVVPGAVADDRGHHKPPVEVMRGVVILADDKLRLLIGAIDDIAVLPTLVDAYRDDFADDMIGLVYVVNIAAPVKLELGGAGFVLIPLLQGVPWNETIDELALEKGDFKGQSAADKIVTLFEEMKGYRPKYPETTLDEVLAAATDVKREGWGAV